MNDQQVHPADMLAQQIDRVAGLLRTLGDLYAPNSESFAAGNSFIAHGLIAASSLLEQAQGAIQNLHHVAVDQFAESATPPILHDETPDDEPLVFPPIEGAWETESELADADQPEAQELSAKSAPAVRDDEFAQSYLELLRKLTAAEVFAAEQQALAPPGSGQNLLPLLRSLREEFQKLHRVA